MEWRGHLLNAVSLTISRQRKRNEAPSQWLLYCLHCEVDTSNTFASDGYWSLPIHSWLLTFREYSHALFCSLYETLNITTRNENTGLSMYKRLHRRYATKWSVRVEGSQLWLVDHSLWTKKHKQHQNTQLWRGLHKGTKSNKLTAIFYQFHLLKISCMGIWKRKNQANSKKVIRLRPHTTPPRPPTLPMMRLSCN